ncbi:MAG: hypothetical protein Q8R53_05205 [Nanoarchaeota archaeon]|nr:hypothetical protein [Nanoarchaeota archaeon]
MSKDTERKGTPRGGTETEGLEGRLGSRKREAVPTPSYTSRFSDSKAVYADLKGLRGIGNLVEGEIKNGNYLTALFLLEALPLEYRPATDPLYLGIAVGMAVEYGQRAEQNPALREALGQVSQYCFQRAGRYDLVGKRPDEPYQIPSASPGSAVGPSVKRSPPEGPVYQREYR